MRPTTTIFLTVLLAGLGWYYFSSRPSSPLPQTELPPIEILKLKEGDSVTWLRLERRDTRETLALRREPGEGWRLEFPISYPAEGLLIDGVVSALKLTRRNRRLSFSGEPPAELGFQPPRIRVGIETDKDAKQRFLVIGEDAPIGGAVYARWEDEKEYFLMPVQMKAALETSTYSLRRKKLFRVNWGQVVKIEVQRGKKHYVLERQGERWTGKAAGRSGEISLEKAGELIYALESAYVKDFLDGKNPGNHEFRLLPDFAFIEAEDGKGAKDRLILGARAKNQEALYGVREKENLVLLISEAKIRSVLQDFEKILGTGLQGRPVPEGDLDSGKPPENPGTNPPLVRAGAPQPV